MPSEHGTLERAPDRSSDPPAVPRRFPQRRHDRDDGAVDRSRTRCRRLAVCGAGAALAVSDIPFAKNVAAVRVGRDENGKYIINPTLAAVRNRRHGHRRRRHRSTRVMMVEGGGHEISEEDFLGAVEFASRRDQEDRHSDRPAAKKAGKKKRTYPLLVVDAALDAWMRKNFKKDVAKAMRVIEKGERNAAFAKFSREAALEKVRSERRRRFARARRQEQQRLRQDHQDDGRGRASRHGRRREVASRRSQGRRDPADLVEGRHTCRASTVPACSRADKRRCSPLRPSDRSATSSASTGSWRFRTSATCTTTTSRRIRSARRARCAAPGRREIGHGHLAERALVPRAAAAGRVPLHDACDQRNARIQRIARRWRRSAVRRSR